MEISFKGKRALVTGGGRGIGKSIAQALLKCGAEVIILDKIEADLQKFKEEEPSIIPLPCDLCDWDATRKAVESVGPVHLLVNSAGVAVLTPFVDVKKSELDWVFSVNFQAIVNVSQVVAKGMIDRGEGGAIVNISSMTTNVAFSEHTSYTSSKGAVDSLTKIMALELGPHQIRVNAIHPTIVLTDMGKIAWEEPKKRMKYVVRTPMGHLAEPTDIADGAVYLLSDMAKMVNGTILHIDGGLTCN
ncbi:L-xylulose reductase-like [Mercenaria mercenaria]|uniref:L-xylulose reductase-like n=1 Tax=Mercenaria mercenaria TaxID=6596 RepID=UPI001E1D9F37|nr:L-xylulose reductase-like [Mercenaria mercenaria]